MGLVKGKLRIEKTIPSIKSDTYFVLIPSTNNPSKISII